MGERAGAAGLGYQPALDGLRAVAVLGVLLYHDETLALLPGGFLGVDVFFVLSGFLITAVLLGDHAATGSTISIRFWARRARRLLPAFLVMVLLVCAYAVFAAPPETIENLRGDGIAALFYVQNWNMAYWNFVPTVFAPTWSLSVEEQWYFVWPFLLAGLLWLSRGRPRRLVGLLLVLIGASALLMAHLAVSVGWWRAFFGTDTRAWELLAGAALAVVVLRSHTDLTHSSARLRIAREGAGFAALAFLGFAFATFNFSDHNLYPGGRLLVVVAVVALLAAVVHEQSPVLRRALGWRPLLGIGVISYGLYLYHIPLWHWLSARRTGLDGLALFVVRFGALFAFAAASYRWVEAPIRRGKQFAIRGPILAPVALLTVLAIFVATITIEIPNPRALLAHYYQDLAAATPPSAHRLLIVGDGSALELGLQLESAVDLEGIRGTTAGNPTCAVAGGDVSLDGIPVPAPDCARWLDPYRDAVNAFEPDVTALMVGNAEVFDRYVAGKHLTVGSPALADYLTSRLEQARRVLTPHRTPLLLLTVPCSTPSPTDPSAAAALHRDPTRIAWLNRVWADFAAAHRDSVRLVDLHQFLCSPTTDPTIRPDGKNFDKHGARALWQWLAPIAGNALSNRHR